MQYASCRIVHNWGVRFAANEGKCKIYAKIVKKNEKTKCLGKKSAICV